MTLNIGALVAIYAITLTPYFIVSYVGKICCMGFDHPWRQSKFYEYGACSFVLAGWVFTIVFGVINAIWGSNGLWGFCVLFIALSMIVTLLIGTLIAEHDAKRYSY